MNIIFRKTTFAKTHFCVKLWIPTGKSFINHLCSIQEFYFFVVYDSLFSYRFVPLEEIVQFNRLRSLNAPLTTVRHTVFSMYSIFSLILEFLFVFLPDTRGSPILSQIIFTATMDSQSNVRAFVRQINYGNKD